MMTERQREQLLRKIQGTKFTATCLSCGGTDWDLADHVLQLPEFRKANTLPGTTEVVPVVLISCKSCGTVRLGNAIKLGIIGQSGDWIDD